MNAARRRRVRYLPGYLKPDVRSERPAGHKRLSPDIARMTCLLRTRSPRSTLAWGGARLPGGRGSKECFCLSRNRKKSQSIVYCVVRRLSARPRSGPLTLAVMMPESLHTANFVLDFRLDFMLYIKYDEDGQTEDASEETVKPPDCSSAYVCRVQVPRTRGGESQIIRQRLHQNQTRSAR